MAGLKLVLAPADDAIPLAEAKEFLRVEADYEDATIESLVSAAHRTLEDRWNWSFVTQTWDYFLDAFPVDCYWRPLPIELPRGPLQSISSVKYTIENGSTLTVSASDYYVDTTNSYKPRVIPNINKAWPGDLLRIANGVEIRMVTGYGLAEAVPEQIRATLKQLVAYWYEHRDERDSIPNWVDDALDSVRGGFAFA